MCIQCILEAKEPAMYKLCLVSRNSYGNSLANGTSSVFKGDVLCSKTGTKNEKTGRTRCAYIFTGTIFFRGIIIISENRFIKTFADKMHIHFRCRQPKFFFVCTILY